MLVLSFRQMTGLSRHTYSFRAADRALYRNRKKLCDFKDIEKIVIDYDAGSAAPGSIQMYLQRGVPLVLYQSTDYNDLSLHANELSALVQVAVET